jgi:hypothetical protein
MRAGRGFWPGLCTTLKHSSTFASFVLLAKGDYPAELCVPLPFALVADDPPQGRLVVLPAYWWLHNMYALARNTWKFITRDKRKTKTQHVEFEALAPDTAEEIFHALELLEIWTARAHLGREPHEAAPESEKALARLGRELLEAPDQRTAGLEVLGERMENSRRKVVIRGVRRGYHAYRRMLHYYAVKNLLDYLVEHPQATRASLGRALAGPRQRNWINLGGQLVAAEDVDALRADIASGKLDGWPAIHARYDELWQDYPLARQRHALATLLELLEVKSLDKAAWNDALDEAVRIQEMIRDEVYRSRKKDYDNPFQQMTFRNSDEMKAVLGTAEQNSFVQQVRDETESFRQRVESVRRRG